MDVVEFVFKHSRECDKLHRIGVVMSFGCVLYTIDIVIVCLSVRLSVYL